MPRNFSTQFVEEAFSKACPSSTGDIENTGTDDGSMIRFTEVKEGTVNMIQLFADLSTVEQFLGLVYSRSEQCLNTYWGIE